jgi:hypothetical protein
VAKSELRLESFTIFQDHSQPVTSNHVDTAVDVKSRIDEHEDMELHPSVTAVFRPETVDGAVVESLNLNDSMKGLPVTMHFFFFRCSH